MVTRRPNATRTSPPLDTVIVERVRLFPAWGKESFAIHGAVAGELRRIGRMV